MTFFFFDPDLRSIGIRNWLEFKSYPTVLPGSFIYSFNGRGFQDAAGASEAGEDEGHEGVDTVQD